MVRLPTRPELGQVMDAIQDRAILRLNRSGHITRSNRAAPKILGCPARDLAGRHCSFLFADGDVDLEKARDALEVAASAGQYEHRGWLARGDGSHFWAEVTIAPLAGHGGPGLEYIAAIRDLTRQKRHEDGLKAALDVSRAILAGLEVGAAFQMIAERARALVRADLAEVRAVDASGTMLVLRGVSERRRDQATEDVLVPDLPVQGSVWGSVFESGRPRLVPDPGATPPHHLHAQAAAMARAMPGPALVVPLKALGRTIGVLTASSSRDGTPLERHDVHTMAVFANQVALAVQRLCRRRDQERRMLIEERRRLGRDIHDGVIQSLYAVTLGLTVAIERAQDLRLQRQLASMTTHVDGVIANLRGLVRELRSSGGS